MRQILNHLRTGEVVLAEVPAPSAVEGQVVIRTRVSLVSLGTERMLVQFGKATLFQKARSQPDKVRQVLAKIRADGLVPTLEAVFRRLDEPLPLGYCNVGVVTNVGPGVTQFAVGDRVVSNGPHAEFVSVPVNLVAKVPPGVSDHAAAFTVLGAIGLQGIRLARPEIGETCVVIGLGLIGQLTAQLLVAAGCRVIGFDFDPQKVEQARQFGVDAAQAGAEADPVKQVMARTGGLGADFVLITASTSSDEVIAQAAHMSRKRGRIVLVGVVGLNLRRADFYEKELTFQVSCSYGPGRYEEVYEQKGHDYPPAFVRWTENRNFQAFLEAMAASRLNVEPLITRRVPLADFRTIYDAMDGNAGLASLLEYPSSADNATTVRIAEPKFDGGASALAIVGAGNFVKMTALPALVQAGAKIKAIVSASGATGTHLARKYGVPVSTTDFAGVLADAQIRAVIIATRHNLHATQALAALRAGKHVLVEKPLCLTMAELEAIEQALAASTSGTAPATLTVGFNRRFSPHAEAMRRLLGEVGGPATMVMSMNAGAVPANHWVHDPSVGGGRLVGEACHFIDLAIYLAGSPVVSVAANALGAGTDTASIHLRHANGSLAVVNYFANGNKDLSKERVEAHVGGRTLLLDNFRELRGHGFRRFRRLATRQDKGHGRQFALFAERLAAGGPPLIPWREIVNCTRATLAVPQALATGGSVAIPAWA